jgi:hypothetical protein
MPTRTACLFCRQAVIVTQAGIAAKKRHDLPRRNRKGIKVYSQLAVRLPAT